MSADDKEYGNQIVSNLEALAPKGGHLNPMTDTETAAAQTHVGRTAHKPLLTITDILAGNGANFLSEDEGKSGGKGSGRIT